MCFASSGRWGYRFFRISGALRNVRIGRPFMIESLRPIEPHWKRPVHRHCALMPAPKWEAVIRQKHAS